MSINLLRRRVRSVGALLRPAAATRASFSTTRRDVAPLQPLDSAPQPWRRGLRYDIWDYVRGRFEAARKRSLIMGVGLLAASAYAAYTWGPKANTNSAFDAFETGAMGGVGTWNNDSSATVARPELDGVLGTLLRPRAIRQYAVVIGEHGTGKSTAMRKAARSTGPDGISGVVYFHMGTEVSEFVGGLVAVLGYTTATVDVQAGASRAISRTTKEEALPMWADIKKALSAAASAFMAKHGRPATLVLDNVDVIAKNDPAFLIDLQRFAKTMADAGNLRVVFVSSDGSAPTLMMAQSEWSRAEHPTEVGDIDDEAACAYLKRTGISADVAGASAVACAGQGEGTTGS